MQSLQPDPAARYRNVMDALRRIVATEGVWRPMRGLNATAVGAGPAHALYFASYEKLKKTLSDVIHPGANSHLANGTISVNIHTWHGQMYRSCMAVLALETLIPGTVSVISIKLLTQPHPCIGQTCPIPFFKEQTDTYIE